MTAKAPDTKVAPYHPDKRTIGELLSTTNPPLVVPDWQRSYSWTQSHIETFWNDLTNFDADNPPDSSQREYFLGSVVIVATSARQHLLLDGQQRLATSAILLSVIREFLKRFKVDAAQRLQNKYLVDFDDASEKLVYKLGLNTYDREYFRRRVLEFRDADYKAPTPEISSHYLIDEAWNYFSGIFEAAYKQFKSPEEAYKWALRIQNVLLNSMSVVAVTSTDEDAAAEVFETLNDRGIGLSTPDLLRNLVIRRAKENLRDDIVELWGEVIGFETDAEIKAFLRHYWISRHGDVKTQRLYREIKSYIVAKNIDSLEFSRELKDASVVYRDIIAARDNDPTVTEYLKAVNELGASILYPVALSVMESVDDTENRQDVLSALVTVFVRHSVIGQLENSKLENVIHRLASDIRKGMKRDDILKVLAEFSPSDEDFVASFKRISISRTSTQRYLLRELEIEKRFTEELDVNPPHKVHVEHIYPQTPAANHKLANHNQIVNRLGNLTLLDKVLNIKARNGRLCDKKAHYEKSELEITKPLALAKGDDWTPAMVDERQAHFAELAIEIWPIERP